MAPLSLRPVGDGDQADLLRWRNQPEVRRAMVHSRPISESEHADWWRRTRSDPSKRWYLVLQGDRPVAVLDYFNLDKAVAEGWWGFYLTDLAPVEGRIGLWIEIEKLALDHAFGELGLKRLLCETRASNRAVLALHERAGFRRHGERELADDVDGDYLVIMQAEAGD